MRRGTRVVVALAVLFLAANVIYGFGAGYFWPVGLPTPLNVVATIVLSFLVLRWGWRFASAPYPDRSPEHGENGENGAPSFSRSAQ